MEIENKKKRGRPVKKMSDESSTLQDSQMPQLDLPAIEEDSLLLNNEQLNNNSQSDNLWLETSAINTLDLFAFSVLAVELLQNEGVEVLEGETQDSLLARVWMELETTPGYETCLQLNLPFGPMSRLKMVKLLQLLKRITNENNEIGLNAIQVFQLRKSASQAYKEMIELLVNDFADDKFINSPAFMSILVDLKSQYIIAEMYCGIEDGETFRNYRKGEGKALIKAVFNFEDIQYLPELVAPKAKAVFEEREARILQLLNQGKMTFDDFSAAELQEKIRSFLTKVLKDVNDRGLPELHPDFQEIVTITKGRGSSGRDTIEDTLHREQMASLLNAVEFANQKNAENVLKEMKTASNRYTYEAIPGIVDEFDSPFENLSGLSAHRPNFQDQDYENWNASKRLRTEISAYPSALNIQLDPKNPLSPFQAGRTTPRRRPPGHKNPWSEEETNALERGMEIFGNDWKAIKDHFGEILVKRSNVNLKDRARNIKRKLVKAQQPLGIWASACN